MRRHFVLIPCLLVLLVGAGALGGDLYKWVDEQGNVHYSDKPHPGAQKMELPKAQTYTSPAKGVVPAVRTPGLASDQGAAGSTQFQIVSPQPEESFSNVRSITVSVSVSPGLGPGDTVTFSLDGKTQGPSTSLSATFDDLERGEHTASATLMRGGKSYTAGPVTFYIHLASIHG